MIRVEHDHRFAVPLETGFRYITDIANWPDYWPGLVRVESGSRWTDAGDEASLVVRLLGRDVQLRMSLRRIVPGRLVEYESRQSGLPDARHERHFSEAGGGFDYRLVVEFEPRPGLRGAYDRVLVRRGIGRVLRQTIGNLEDRFLQIPR